MPPSQTCGVTGPHTTATRPPTFFINKTWAQMKKNRKLYGVHKFPVGHIWKTHHTVYKVRLSRKFQDSNNKTNEKRGLFRDITFFCILITLYRKYRTFYFLAECVLSLDTRWQYCVAAVVSAHHYILIDHEANDLFIYFSSAWFNDEINKI